MKKIKKAEKWNIPFEMQKNAYNVRIISFLAFFCICLIAISLVAQIFLSKRIVSEKMLGETAAQRAGMFEEVFDKAKKYLENIKAYCLVMTENYIRNNFKSITENANAVEKRLFDSVDMEELIAENKRNLSLCEKNGENVILIDNEYKIKLGER